MDDIETQAAKSTTMRLIYFLAQDWASGEFTEKEALQRIGRLIEPYAPHVFVLREHAIEARTFDNE